MANNVQESLNYLHMWSTGPEGISQNPSSLQGRMPHRKLLEREPPINKYFQDNAQTAETSKWLYWGIDPATCERESPAVKEYMDKLREVSRLALQPLEGVLKTTMLSERPP